MHGQHNEGYYTKASNPPFPSRLRRSSSHHAPQIAIRISGQAVEQICDPLSNVDGLRRSNLSNAMGGPRTTGFA